MTRNLTKQAQPRPRDIVYRTCDLATLQLNGPVQHSGKPDNNNASQLAGKNAPVVVNEARRLSGPKQHSPAVNWWLDQDRRTQAWHHLAVGSRSTSSTESGRPDLREQTYRSHPTSASTSRTRYSDGTTDEHSSQMQGSGPQQQQPPQGNSPHVLRDTPTLISCHSRFDGRREDLMCIGQLFT